VAYGQSGAVYQNDGIIVATNSPLSLPQGRQQCLKDDGSMGAAFVSMGGRLVAAYLTVT
jgi:hypothetical protein